MNRTYLYIERNLQEVLLSGSETELEEIKQNSLELLNVSKAAIISKGHFTSLQKAWQKDGYPPIHSAVGKVMLFPNLDSQTGESTVQLFMDLTRLLIIKGGKPRATSEVTAVVS